MSEQESAYGERVHRVPRLGRRSRSAHKGAFGRVLIIAGSRAMPGAAVLCARAALRAGSGLVTLAIPDDLVAAFPAAVPEATFFLLPPSTERDPEVWRHTFQEALKRDWDAIGIGPGLGTAAPQRALVEVAGAWGGPTCFDADALNIVARGAAVSFRSDRVWTPHPGEFKRLTGSLPTGRDERLRAATAFVRDRGGVIVLKGRESVVHSGARYFVNLTGNPGMATGGTGDILTGIITSLLGQGLSSFDAAVLGAHVHGLAADFAARVEGEASLVAGDLVDRIGEAIEPLISLDPRARRSR